VEGVRLGIHVCRGNWSRQEEVLLSGDYGPLLPAFEAMKVRQSAFEKLKRIVRSAELLRERYG
jgi:5-methyltetrahydropteroyltriglutamate--homocysteine methyltransferase